MSDYEEEARKRRISNWGFWDNDDYFPYDNDPVKKTIPECDCGAKKLGKGVSLSQHALWCSYREYLNDIN